MFSRGQLIFAICFIVFFAVALIMSYKKDRESNKKYYAGVVKILIGFALFIIILFVVKYVLAR